MADFRSRMGRSVAPLDGSATLCHSAPVAVLSSHPAQGAYGIAPEDGLVLRQNRGIYVGVTGDVALVTAEGDSVIFKNVPVGILQVACTQVLSTGTTASSLMGLV